MKLGSILGALSPGLSATGLFGNAAQGVGQGMLSSVSPILAMLLKNKKKKGGKQEVDPNAALAEAGKTAVNRPAITPNAPIAPAAYGPGTMPAIMQGGMSQMPGGFLQTGMAPTPSGLFGR